MDCGCNKICWFFSTLGFLSLFLYRKYYCVFVKDFVKNFWLPKSQKWEKGFLLVTKVAFPGAVWIFFFFFFLNFLFEVLREFSKYHKLRMYPTGQLYLLLNSNSWGGFCLFICLLFPLESDTHSYILLSLEKLQLAFNMAQVHTAKFFSIWEGQCQDIWEHLCRI